MSFLELFSIVLSAAGLFASILGTFLTHASRQNGEATRALVRGTHDDTRALIQEMQTETRQFFDRMDQRADERHREVIEVIRAMRP